LLLAALAAAALVLARRRRGAPRMIQIVETASLGPKRSLVVARVGDELLLLGSSEGGIALLTARPAQPVEAPRATAADHEHLRAAEEGGVACRAVRDATIRQARFAGHAERARRGTGGDDDRRRRDDAPAIGRHPEGSCSEIDLLDACVEVLRPKVRRLLLHFHGEIETADSSRKARVVLDIAGCGDQSARL
jgi:hypothetical protein